MSLEISNFIEGKAEKIFLISKGILLYKFVENKIFPSNLIPVTEFSDTFLTKFRKRAENRFENFNKESENSKIHKCSFENCGKVYHSLYRLRIHMRIHVCNFLF
jgi:uncharacterized Zn-finger protein